MDEHNNKEIENKRKYQKTELKNRITELKNTQMGSSGLDKAEERISYLENRTVESAQTEH